MPRPPSINTHRTRHSQVGILLRTYRESHPNERGGRGISQTELLRLMGSVNPYYGLLTTHVAVSKWESGDTPPTKERIETFGKALGLSEEEVEGLTLLAGLNAEQLEARSLPCPHCGAKTVTEQVRGNQLHTGAELYSNVATRSRKCVSCGRASESTERWSHDPVELRSGKLGRILGQIGRANARILQALTEANQMRDSEGNERDDARGEQP